MDSDQQSNFQGARRTTREGSKGFLRNILRNGDRFLKIRPFHAYTLMRGRIPRREGTPGSFVGWRQLRFVVNGVCACVVAEKFEERMKGRVVVCPGRFLFFWPLFFRQSGEGTTGSPHNRVNRYRRLECIAYTFIAAMLCGKFFVFCLSSCLTLGLESDVAMCSPASFFMIDRSISFFLRVSFSFFCKSRHSVAAAYLTLRLHTLAVCTPPTTSALPSHGLHVCTV